MSQKKKVIVVLAILLIAGATLLMSWKRAARHQQGPSEEAAVSVAMAYGEAVNYKYEHPEAIYAFMSNAYKASISEADFVAAFKKERTYPYLTPLFINYECVELSDDLMTGTAVYSQAARLPGMKYDITLVYEDGTYHVEDFESFPDGSYLEKFDTVTYDLSSYFDTEMNEQ